MGSHTPCPLFSMEEARLLRVDTKCVADDETIDRHIVHALSLNLPVLGQHFEHDGVAVLIGSGPSVETQLDSIKRQRVKGRPLIAIKDAHDWLIEHGIVPDYAIAIDPQEHRWACFMRKHPDVKYFIASQCHPKMFEHLAGHHVWLFHLVHQNGQSYPPKTVMIGGGTTTGMRAITLFYTLGFNRFELYGYDSCLSPTLRLRVTETEHNGQPILPVKVGERTFLCNPAMAVQAQHFQKIFTEGQMPDLVIQSHGDGLISAILDAREAAARQLVTA